MNHLVLRLSIAAALLMQLSLACGFARGQSHTALFDLPASGRAPIDAVSPPRPLAVQFPATNASLIAATSLDYSPSSSRTISDPGDLSAFNSGATFDASAAMAEAVPSWPARLPSAASKANPKTYYSENPRKWQLGLAFALVRFRSSVYSASAPGLNSSLAYWWKEWVAIEGSITSAFAPPVFANEHFRYLSYGAGPKFSLGHGRLEPWAHALVGGVHLLPQTGNGGRNGAEFTLGGGIDYLINDVISAKGGVDYVGTHMFGEWQSSLQIVAGFSLRF